MKTQKAPLSNVLETPNGKNVASTQDRDSNCLDK